MSSSTKTKDDTNTEFTTIEKGNHVRIAEYITSCKYPLSYDKFITEYKSITKDVSTSTGFCIKYKSHNINIRYNDSKYQVKCTAKSNINCFKELQKWIDGYYQYDQRFYISQGHLISTINHNNKKWFDLYQISDILNYTKSSYLTSYYLSRYNLESYSYNHHIYTDINGLQEILKRGRKPGCKKIMEDLGLDIAVKIQSHEANILENIIDFLSDQEIKYELQYPLGSYRLDMYIPVYKVVIEVDEIGHSDRDLTYEKERENYIKSNLTRKILRINPNDVHFRIAREISKLNKLMNSK